MWRNHSIMSYSSASIALFIVTELTTHPLAYAHFSTRRYPRSAAVDEVRSSQGHGTLDDLNNVSICIARSSVHADTADAHAASLMGHPSRITHSRMSGNPSAADAVVLASHGHPFKRNHLSISCVGFISENSRKPSEMR
jgi:hypothetical protein